MAKPQSRYICQSCGAVYSKWAGRCEECGTWNSVVEEQGSGGYSKVAAIPGKKSGSGREIEFASLDQPNQETLRTQTGINELDRVLGGGLVAGSGVLIGGDPGIGKSTLLLQLASAVALNDEACVYITGEESVEQIRMRAARLGLKNAPMAIAAATSVRDILATLKKGPAAKVVIIDSVQTMYLDSVESAPGTVTQVRSSAYELISFAKQSGAAILLVGHVTKDGQIAGPKVLEHMVDTVLYFEGERGHQFRILRSVKNRFGPANEIGVFEMTEKGLMEVANPSALFLSESHNNVSGSAIFAGMEGTRPLLVEIQALVAPSFLATPRRAVVGWDINRLAMIIAVLGTRAGVQLYDKEVYLNVAGGLKINEPAADLPVAAAIISSLSNVSLPKETVIFGEVGLSGEVRKVSHVDIRLKEAEKLGFTRAIVPGGTKSKHKTNNNFILREINHINQLKQVLGSGD